MFQPGGGFLEAKGVAVAEDNIARGEAHGDGAHRPVGPLRGLHRRVSLPDHVCWQSLEVDAAVRDGKEV